MSCSLINVLNYLILYRNWCAHVVHRNVSGAVLSGTEVFVQPEHRPCAPGRYPDCAQHHGYVSVQLCLPFS